MRTLPLLALLALAGCPPFIWPSQHDFGQESSNPPGETPWIDTDEDGEVIGRDTDDDAQSPYQEPWAFLASFYFAVDVDGSGAPGVVGYGVAETSSAQYPAGVLALFTQNLQPICVVAFVEEGADVNTPIPPTLLDDDIHTGFELPTGAQIYQDCDGKLDPQYWGNNLEAQLSALRPGVGITGAVSSTVEAEVQQAIQGGADPDAWEREFEGNLVGARAYVNGTPVVGNQGAELAFGRALALRDPSYTTHLPWVAWGDVDNNGAWDAGEYADPISADEILATPPDRAAWIVQMPRPHTYGVPLRYILTGTP